LTIDGDGKIAIWRHPAAPLANARAPFPAGADIAFALRVVEAVGMARGTILSDEIALRTSDSVSNVAVHAMNDQLQADQIHFEAVAEAIRSFGCTSDSGTPDYRMQSV
jgi:hypothetical protein